MKNKANPLLNAVILEAVDSQLRDLNPPEAKETYEWLIASGISDKEARRLIAVALSSEMFDVLKYNKNYSPERYLASLRKLPKLPGISSGFGSRTFETLAPTSPVMH